MCNYGGKIDKPQHLTEADLSWNIDSALVNGVITAAVWSVERKPGTWSKMLVALGRGAIKSKEGTVEAFLFRAMLDRLLEEFHALESD